MQNSYSKEEAMCEVTYAGFWVRLAAYLIDSIIVFAGLLIVRLILAGFMGAVQDTFLGGNILFQYDLKDIVLYVLEAVYFVLFTYYTGTTLGKRLLNLRVVRADGEEKLSLLSVVYRETIGRFLSSVICGLGYLLIGVDKEKRGFHDILSDTRVIYARKVKVYEKTVKFTAAEPYAGEKESEKTEEKSAVMPWEAAYTPLNHGEGDEVAESSHTEPEEQNFSENSKIEENETERDS